MTKKGRGKRKRRAYPNLDESRNSPSRKKRDRLGTRQSRANRRRPKKAKARIRHVPKEVVYPNAYAQRVNSQAELFSGASIHIYSTGNPTPPFLSPKLGPKNMSCYLFPANAHTLRVHSQAKICRSTNPHLALCTIPFGPN
jgi:hypothetical protein